MANELEASESPVSDATTASADGAVSTESSSAVVTDPLGTKNPASNGAPAEQSVKDWQKEYERAEAARAAVEKSYNEARQRMSIQGREKNEAKARFDSLEKTLKHLSEGIAPLLHKETYNPDQFMEDLRAQGPQFVLDLVKKQREELLADTTPKIESLMETVTKLETKDAVNARLSDSENYPDFKALEPAMVEIYESSREVFDAKYPELGAKIDALYNFAKLQRSPDALKQAEALGAKRTEAALIREAHTAGAGGGKAGAVSVLDPRKDNMTLDQMRKYFADHGLVKDY